MFEAITVSTVPVSVEKLVDVLCFYGRVNFSGNAARIVELVSRLGYSNAQRLVESGLISLVVDRYQYSIVQPSPALPIFDSGTVSLAAANVGGTPIDSVADELELQYVRRFGQSAKVRAEVRFLADHAIEAPSQGRALAQAREDFLDRTYIQLATNRLLRIWAPDYRVPFLDTVAVRLTSGELAFDLPVDFDAINKEVRKRYTAYELTVTPALILAQIIEARKEIVANVEGKSDLWLSEPIGELVRGRIHHAAHRLYRGTQELVAFNEVVLRRKSIGSVVAAGNRSIEEVIDLLENEVTQKFKRWLGTKEAEANLVQEYYKDTYSSAKWQSGAKYKLGKITIFTALGALADLALGASALPPVASRALSIASDAVTGAADEFLLDSIARGWRPNHWVDDVVLPFTRGPDDI